MGKILFSTSQIFKVQSVITFLIIELELWLRHHFVGIFKFFQNLEKKSEKNFFGHPVSILSFAVFCKYPKKASEKIDEFWIKYAS